MLMEIEKRLSRRYPPSAIRSRLTQCNREHYVRRERTADGGQRIADGEQTKLNIYQNPNKYLLK